MGDTNFSSLVASTFTGALVGSITGQLTYTTAARTTTATGATTGTIADAGLLQFVTVTSGGADEVIILPTPTPGTMVLLAEAGTGYELRSSATATVAINGGTDTTGESAIAADTLVFIVCTSATSWQGYTIAGATLAAIEAAADV